ncbi:hypothetical protein FB451DRAFT_503490 [Mycena latifolia]|nr:hypothetical protein FB451DRAFT_503490 [Mycena latifolia]
MHRSDVKNVQNRAPSSPIDNSTSSHSAHQLRAPPRPSHLTNTQPTRLIKHTLLAVSSASSSTISLVSTATVSSRAPLNGTAPAPPKDFQDTFARLQSTYGFSGFAPTPVPPKNPAARSLTNASSRAPSAPIQPKDFEGAFATLQSTYGFSGNAPVPIQNPHEQASTSLFSRLTRSSPKTRAASTSTKTKVRHIPRPTPHMIAL